MSTARPQGTQAFLARARCAPGTRIPPHWHSEDTIAYLAEGKAVFRSGDDLADVHEMSAGDWLFVPAGMVHVEETPADSSGDFLYARAGAGGDTTYLEEDPDSSRRAESRPPTASASDGTGHCDFRPGRRSAAPAGHIRAMTGASGKKSRP